MRHIQWVEKFKKPIRKNCPHYQSGGWCRYEYNTASEFDIEHYNKAKKEHRALPKHEELINTCNWHECSRWLEELFTKMEDLNS